MAVGAFVAGLSMSTAVAAPKPANDKVQAVLACIADADKLCKGVPAGGGLALACLADKTEQLSPKCRGEIEPIGPTVKAWRDTCGADIDAYCSEWIPGLGLFRCLQSHRPKLSKQCKGMVFTAEATTLLSCASDAGKLCKGVEPGAGRVLACLAKNHSKLTGACKASMPKVKGNVTSWRRECGTELDTHCPKSIPGYHALGCLSSKRDSLSAKCKAKMDKAAVVYGVLCGKDMKEHCAGVPHEGGKMFDCLRQHHDELTNGCMYVVPAKATPPT